jgi:triacylglycerol lipase
MHLAGAHARPAAALRSLLALAFLFTLASPAASASAADEPLPPQGASPPGTNDFGCKPPPRHPYPVVLVHGTYLNMTVSWNVAAPALTRLGYCVFALDYGNSPFPGINAVGDIPTSARQLKTFVGRVRAATGASKVSIVGHSQGGMMPRYLIKFLGGAAAVDDLVGMSPSNHGTTNPAAPTAAAGGCIACGQQIAGSDFMKELNAGDQTPPPVSYTVVETRYDEVVTPYESEFLPDSGDGRVTNVLLQDTCPADATDHIGITDDPVAIQWVLNALGRPGPAAPDFAPDCTGAGAATFPDSSSVPEDGSGTGGGTGGGSGGSNSGGPGEGSSNPSSRRVRLVIGRLSRGARAAKARRLRVPLTARGGKVRRVRVTVRSRAGSAVVGRSRLVAVARRRVVTVRLRRTPSSGRYVVVARGRDARGRVVVAKRRFALR